MSIHRNGAPIVLASLVLAIACGGEGREVAGQSVTVDVQPREAQVETGGTVVFASAVTGALDTTVDWTVIETAGGTVDAGGAYRAPASTGQFHVVATSRADPTKSATATVTVTGPAAACATAPLRTTGTTYYYCDCGAGAAAGCTPGSDANPGTSPTAPRRTLANAITRFGSMRAGDTVALCRTGSFSGSGGLDNSSCRAGTAGWPPPADNTDTCDLRDYVPAWATAASPRPIVNGSFGVTSNTEGYRLWNLDVRHNGGGNGTIFLYYGANNLDFCNLRLDGQGGSGGCGICAQQSHNATGSTSIRNCEFYDYGFSAIYGGAQGFNVDSNVFRNNGLDGTPQMHTIYLCPGCASDGAWPSPASSTANIRFVNNELVTDGRCGGVMLVLHGSFNGALFENNLISTTSTDVNCYGFQTAASILPGDMRGIRLRRNRVFTQNSTGVELSCCRNCEASDNVIVRGGLELGTTYDCNGGPGSTALTAYNNTLYLTGLALGSQGTGHVVQNNAVWTSAGSCFSLAGAPARNDGNYCRSSGGVAVGAVFVDAPNGDFRPSPSGPLIGSANQTYYSLTAIGSVQWSPADAGVPRSPPVDAGAVGR